MKQKRTPYTTIFTILVIIAVVWITQISTEDAVSGEAIRTRSLSSQGMSPVTPSPSEFTTMQPPSSVTGSGSCTACSPPVAAQDLITLDASMCTGTSESACSNARCYYTYRVNDNDPATPPVASNSMPCVWSEPVSCSCPKPKKKPATYEEGPVITGDASIGTEWTQLTFCGQAKKSNGVVGACNPNACEWTDGNGHSAFTDCKPDS